MGIKSIKVTNLLSFDKLVINDFTDINCIIGQNNAGKSNLLKLIRYFYEKLDNKKVLPPDLHSPYSSYGSISIVYDTTRIRGIVTSKKNNSNFLKHIYNVLFKKEADSLFKGSFKGFLIARLKNKSVYELTLRINSDESIDWSVKDKQVRDILSFLYPFFEVETRHIDLYDWEKLWYVISKLKTFNVSKLEHSDVVKFFDESISEDSKSYSDYINKIDGIIDTSKYSYREKVLNYIKVGLKGHTFMVSGEELTFQSDGTNSYKYIELLLTLLISLTRREYITPTIYIDEPETGLHPKRNEELIYKLYDVYKSFEKTKKSLEIGKYKTPYPIIIFSTHSENILKYIIKLFGSNQQVLHFSKNKNKSTSVQVMNSQYSDKRFINTFSDNEARLFFSNFILFVEGETELEVFGNLKLLDRFPILKKIDVYKNNGVTLKYTNPSYANLSIPYLVLYDADKLIDYNVVGQNITFLDNSININGIYKKVKRSYYGSNHYAQKVSIKNLIYNSDKKYKTDPKNVKYIDRELSKSIKSINSNILLQNNYVISSTTIEGSLINISNIHLFNKWLISEIINNTTVKHSKNITKTIDAHKRMLKRGSGIDKVFKSLLCLDGVDVALTEEQRRFIKSVKLLYLKEVKTNLSMRCNDIDELLILYRLVFGGKTDTLISRVNKSYNIHIDATFRTVVEDTKSKYFSPLKSLTGKTGGWVTRFLDYSVESIKHNNANDEFENTFKHLFPEIYDIICIASSSIE